VWTGQGEGLPPGPLEPTPPKIPPYPPQLPGELRAAAARASRARAVSQLRLLAAVVALALAVGFAGAGLVTRLRDDALPLLTPSSATPGPATRTPAVLDRPAQSQELERRTAFEQVLKARAAAVIAGSRSRWLATIDPGANAFRAHESALFDRLRLLPLETWGYTVIDDTQPLPSARRAALGTDAYLVQVRLDYRFTSDVIPLNRTERLTFHKVNGSWLIAGDRDGAGDQDLWDLGAISVVTGKRSLVVGPVGQRSRLRRYARDADVAARAVDAVWGTQWPRTVVLVVPSSLSQMATVLGRTSTAGLDQLAAVTTGEVWSGQEVPSSAPRGTADRVVVNPQAFAHDFASPTRRLVLTHEFTHVATRATSRVTPPLWAEEGFADYVAYLHSGLSKAVIAQSLLKQVRAGTVPAHLPSASDFDPTKGDIGLAYAGSWMAFMMMQHAGGTAEAVAFYREASAADLLGHAGESADQALQQAFMDTTGLSRSTFEQHWQDYLVGVAKNGG